MLRLLALLLALGTCVQAQDKTIFQYLQENGYTKLTEFIIGAGLQSEFEATDAIKTLFAPSDAAFAKLPNDLVISLSTNATLLKEVLLGHVVVGEALIGLFIRDGVIKTSGSGEQLNFNVYPNKVKTVNGAQIVGNDVVLLNGVLHMVNKVLLPVKDTISNVLAESDPEFRDLTGFLVLAKLYATLATPGPFTIFAPMDSSFAQMDVTGLIANRTALADVLKNHVVSGAYWSAGLTNGMTLTTLFNKQITIEIGASTGVAVNNIPIVAADVPATNGVIHVISGVLAP